MYDRIMYQLEEYMDSTTALTILFQNIRDIRELMNNDNKWIMHSLYVGQAASTIAKRLNLNADYAETIGYMHDIGRLISHSNHVIEGYKYLDNLGYPDIARYCITHSFVDNIIPNTAGGGPNKDSYDFINNYLNNITLNIYDNIVQLCDLFCLETGYTTFEKRILDITKRKGVYPNSLEHFKSIMELKNRLENMMGITIYELFPQIKDEDLASQNSDYEELMKLFKNDQKQSRKT
jgi:putative nucleotidyltransferase with HDIG domain